MTEYSTRKTTNKFLKFGDFEITKIEFHCSKNVMPINDLDAEKTLVSNELTCSKNKETYVKYSTGYKKEKEIRQLVVRLNKQRIGYLHEFKRTKYISFLVTDKSNWDKISNIIEKEFDKNPIGERI